MGWDTAGAALYPLWVAFLRSGLVLGARQFSPGGLSPTLGVNDNGSGYPVNPTSSRLKTDQPGYRRG